MAQHDFVINNQGFPAFRSDLNDFLNAVRTTHSGTSRPTGAVAGTIWLDTTTATAPILKYYDGSDDITLATIDHVANTVNFIDSSISITGISTTATGTVLTITDTANTTTVNLIIDNQKEIRFRETTANGTNYVALKAPASLASDLTFTLPSAYGNNGQVLTSDGSGGLSFTTPSAGIAFQSAPRFANFTAVAGEGYFCDTLGLERTVSVQSVSGNNKFFIGGVQQPTLELVEGNTYVFNYPSAHPFAFSTTSDGTHGGGTEYTTGITRDTVNYKLTYVVPSSAPTLYYYCTIHSGMGGQANTPASQPSFTVTLPATPSAGNQIALVDYAGTFDTNALLISPNGNKIEGSTDNVLLSGEREGATLTFIDATQGWLATSGINEGTDALAPTTYSVDFLVIAGGGAGGGDFRGGGGGAGGYRNSYSTETSGGGGSSEASLTFTAGTVYTVTVGAGGSGVASEDGNNGANSSISGTGITTITSTGGGGGGQFGVLGEGTVGKAGGSGGGGGSGTTNRSGGSGTANQGFAGGNASGNIAMSGGGGGASAVGFNSNAGTGGTDGDGGAGLASSITGSSVSRAGGGGSGSYNGLNETVGGVGGGGVGGVGHPSQTRAQTAGTVNTGSGGGGSSSENVNNTGANGGKGVVILRIPTANYSNTTTGSPTVTTDGSDKVIVFNDSGSITG